MTNVRVAYASKPGSTAEIADAIAGTLRQSGLRVDCIDAGKVNSVASYDAVVRGSAVYIKRWRGDAKHFLRKHDRELSQRPLWVFSSGPVGDPKTEADPSWLEPPTIIEHGSCASGRGNTSCRRALTCRSPRADGARDGQEHTA